MNKEFLSTVDRWSLCLKITRPSRITPHCAALIDNIFTNDMENITVSGLLINDISDHLPVSGVNDTNYEDQPGEQLRHRHVRTEETNECIEESMKTSVCVEWSCGTE